MEKIKIDCALLFALEEEHEIIEEHKEVFIENNDYSYFTFLDKNKNERKCLTAYVGEPSSSKAYKFIQEFNKNFNPSLIVVIGLSGQLSDDVLIGDIVIAKSIDKYDFNQKFKNGKIKFSGETINLKGFETILKRIKENSKKTLNEWNTNSQNKLKELFTDIQIKELIEKEFIRNTLKNDITYGKVATGESVVDDNKVKDAIISKDRKLLCVDMESFGFADSLENTSNLIILRTISDTSDGRKKELDKFGDKINGLRKYALENVFYFFDKVILQKIDFSDENRQINYKPPKLGKIDSFIKLYGENAFPVYSDLFKSIILEKDILNNQDIYKYLRNLLSDATAPIFISGQPGSGKSSLLYTFYQYLLLKGVSTNYIDIHNYRRLALKPDTVINRFERDINIIIRNGNYEITIIDGLDEFERFFFNKKINLEEYWSSIASISDKIILGVTQQDFDNEDDETPLFFTPEPFQTINLVNFDFTIQQANSILDKLCTINQTVDTQRIKTIKEFIENTNIKEIDWHTINLLTRKLGTFNYRHIKTLGQFLHLYAREFLSKNEFSDHKKQLKESAKIAFTKYIKELNLTEDQYRSRNWHFIQQSNNIKQFFIAEHLISQYKKLIDDFDNSVKEIGYVYSYKINSYFKDNLNRNHSVQNAVFESTKSMFNRLEINQKPNVCYIMGRINDSDIRVQAKKFLKEQIIIELDNFRNRKYHGDKDDFRQHLMLIRTTFISLVYLGDYDFSTKYLNYILVNPEWDDLNRGFHLEYYGDKKYDPKKLGQHNDILSLDFLKTYHRLSRRIKNTMINTDVNYYPMFDIELQTITSLAINRFVNTTLNSAIKDDLINILDSIIENNFEVLRNQEMRPFISMAHYILKSNKSSVYSILKDIYNIKNVKRSGWNYEREFDNGLVKRKVKHSESVADHSFGAVLIGLLLLPDELPSEKEYSKIKIIKTLIIHDLAEAFIGDINSFEKSEEIILKESDQMKLIMSLSILDGFGNFVDYRELIDDFNQKRTINGSIAYEIDKMENLLQLLIYKENENNIITDFENWKNELIEKVNTNMGSEILRKILGRKNTAHNKGYKK